MTTSAQANIRGIDIDKLAKGFADEENVFKQFLTVSPTSAREIRWYQKTAGFLTGVTTTGITASPGANRSQLARPTMIEPNFTRVTSYVRKYIFDSPVVSTEDLDDADPDLFANIVRDVTRAVQNQVDARIYNALSGSFALSGGCAGTGWGDPTNGNPIQDLLSGSALIRGQGYDISNLTVLLHPNQYKSLLTYIITTKGSSIPAFSSDLVRNGVLTKIMNNNVVVSNNCTSTVVVQFVPQRAATWKTFTPISTAIIDDPGIGKKFRAWEEGEVLVTDVYAGCTLKSA